MLFYRALLVTAIAMALSAEVQAQTPLHTGIIRDLQSGDANTRRAATKRVRKNMPLHPRTTLALIAAADSERDPRTYEELLLALGETGAMEARPIIDRHILSVDKRLAGIAHKALTAWLKANGLLHPKGKLPQPPHPLYGPPPPLPLSAPAAHSLQARLFEPQQIASDGRTLPLPAYLPPPPGAPYAAFTDVTGTAAGFHVEEEPRLGLVIAGAATFGGGYLIGAVVGAVGAASSNNDASGWAPAFIPVVGPIVALGTSDVLEPSGTSGLSAGFGNYYAAIGLVVASLSQITGAVLLPIGYGAPREVERRDAARFVPEVDVGPGATALRWRF